MIFIGKYKEMNKSHDFPSIREFFEDMPYEGQEKVARYLENGTIDMCRMEIPKDVITGENIPMEKLGMNDGEYTWFNILAYYVRKYNLRLPREFEEKILAM